MVEYTSIRVRSETRDALWFLKEEGESYEEMLWRELYLDEDMVKFGKVKRLEDYTTTALPGEVKDKILSEDKLEDLPENIVEGLQNRGQI